MDRVRQLEVEAEPEARVAEGVGLSEALVKVKVIVEAHQHVVREDREEELEDLVVDVVVVVEVQKCSMCAGEREKVREE